MKSVRSKGSGRSLKPVKRIELNDEHTALRLAAFVLLIVVAVGSVGYAVYHLLARKSGWTLIKPENSAEQNCCAEFTFNYELGADGESPTSEYKRLASRYTAACSAAYRIFGNTDEFPDCKDNLRYINEHPNETLKVDKALYDAFKLLEKYGSRYIYAAPVYAQYEALCFCESDAEADAFDPAVNGAVKEYFKAVLPYVNDEKSVSLTLLDGNRVRLFVSDEYMKYAAKQEITSYLDFFWLRNAFIADYIAASLQESGFTHGVINSYDGFTRHLGNVGESLLYNVFDSDGRTVYLAARLEQSDGMNIVSMRDRPMDKLDRWHYYVRGDGTITTPFIDQTDGKCKASLPDLTVYSHKKGCAETALSAYPLYVTESFDEAALKTALSGGVEAVYCIGCTLYYSDENASFAELYKSADRSYSKKLIR